MKIFAIDDEYYALEALVSIISRILGDRTDVAVYKFFSAGEAIEFLPQVVPDIIFTDIRMDEISGIDLCEYVHRHYPAVSLVIISGYEDFAYAQRAIRANVSAYLTKPMKESDIREILFNFMDSCAEEKKGQAAPAAAIAMPSKEGGLIEPLMLRLINYYLIEKKVKPLIGILHKVCNEQLAAGDPGTCAAYLTELGDAIYGHPNIPDKRRAGDDLHRLTAMLVSSADMEAVQNCVTFLIESVTTLFGESMKQDESLAEKIKTYIDENYYDNLNMYDMANNVFFISPNHLSNLLYDLVGMRFSKYLTKVRMENAMELLKIRSLSVSEIAQLSGYNSESHFISSFKRYFGGTPKMFRGGRRQ